MSHVADAFRTARVLTTGLLALVLVAGAPDTASATSRIKDIVEFEGVRENQLVGYGLVVGLNNTGDTLKDGGFTKQSLKSMLNRMGVKPTEDGLESKNVAAVMITASLPAFARQGNRIDVTVSALGDAGDLEGGTLLVTPLMGADSQVYAAAQKAVSENLVRRCGFENSSEVADPSISPWARRDISLS